MRTLLVGAVVSLAVTAGPLQAQPRDRIFRKDPASVEKARGLARARLAILAARHGLAESDLAEKRTEIDDLLMAHTRVQQKHGGVPVWGGEAIVHLDTDGSVRAVTDTLVSDVAVDSTPGLTAAQAEDRAVAEYGCRECLTAAPVADLWVLRKDGRDHLVWRVQLRREDETDQTALPVFFIDAHDGATVDSYDNLQTGSGPSLYSGTVTVNSYFRSSTATYYMEDITNKLGTFDNRNTTASTYRFADANDVWDSSTQRAGVDAHYGALKTYQYYKNTHGRNGIDGSGGPAYYTAADGVTGLVSSKVHYGTSYNNAFWNGSYMTYGDGDGVTFTPLVTVDIAGHEMTHGVTERTAGLVYNREPGALNEAVSDIFGAMVERYARGESANTWLIGEDAYTPGTPGDALRSMADPNAFGDPDHYSLAVHLGDATCDNTNDNCGVHTNSGIANHAYYLLAKGGTNRVSGIAVTGVGADAAARIWYRALTVYMTSSTTFSGARTATMNAAADLYGAGSANHSSTCEAWFAVGVGGTCSGGGGGGTELIGNGGFEGSASPWSLTSFNWTGTGAYPHSGSGYIFGGSANFVSGSAYQQITVPSGGATLSLWLNVTSNETTTVTRYDFLYIEVRNTAGTLLGTLATFSNLDKGTAGVYGQKSYSLAAWAGQTVRIQFRVTTDGSLTSTFRIDDVSAR